MLLDLVKRVFGEVFADLGDDSSRHVTMQIAPQISQGPRRRGDDQCLNVALAHDFLKCCRYYADEMMLLEVMPIRRFDGARPGPMLEKLRPGLSVPCS